MDNSEFNNYLKSEYDHIAEAHFRTIDTITAFFRYYLLIMSIPLSIVAAFFATSQSGPIAFDLLSNYTPVISAISFVISLAGFGVLLYLISLRMDALLYARTVNAIRKHFYDNVPSYTMNLETKIRTRVLPQTASQPKFLEWRYFGPVVSVIALLNTVYFFGSIALIVASLSNTTDWQRILAWTIPFSVIFYGLHFAAYWLYAYDREHSYMKSNTIGVDICGVLNEHRPQFCKVLSQTTGKVIDPEDITIVPVHEHPGLGIKRDDETLVFNKTEYWTEMKPTNSSAERLSSIQRAFRMKVILFTHRPWPNTAKMDSKNKYNTMNEWKKAAENYYQDCLKKRKISRVKLLSHPLRWIRMKIGRSSIEEITRNWLDYHNFNYDKLIVEKGSDDVSDPQAHYKNRFYESRKRKIKFFVEDILEKAEKLAYICDVVFLYDHPYNRNPKRKLPSNIVRVKSWDDIYREVRTLS